MREQRFSVVVPTTGGPGLARLLGALADSLALADRAVLDLHEILVVDDRPGFPQARLDLPEPGPLKTHLRTVRTGGRGAAGARNAGWRSTSAPWVVFLTDDTELTGSWADDLVADLEAAGPGVAALTARSGSTVTDVAYRREFLREAGGFDERPDAETSFDHAAGSRVSAAPAPAGTTARTLPARSALTTPLLAAAAATGTVGAVVKRFRLVVLAVAAGLGAAAFLTSRRPAETTTQWPPRVRAVLFDRDGTLVHDVPYNGDPGRVEPVEGAREAVAAARRAGLKVGVVTNQSGVARGLITRDQVDAVNARVEELLGPFDTWQVCPHGPDDGCDCRKPAPAMLLAAARDLGVEPYECAYVGDQASDVAAAHAAGARPVLVSATAPEDGTAETAPDLGSAVDELIVTAASSAARG